ncbi:MAG: leucine-rich repeat protein [Christensenellales bacterium]
MKKYIKAILLILILLPFSTFLVACNNNGDTYYTVTFDSNGGSNVKPVQVKENELITKPTNPTQDDFTFIGWYYGDEEWSFTENKVNQDLTLTAKWEHTYLLIDENKMLTGITDYGKTLNNVTIPNSVTSVKLGALSGCSSLESLTTPFVGNSANTSDTNQYPFGYLFGKDEFVGGVSTEQYYYDLDSDTYESITYNIPSTLTAVTITSGNIPFVAFGNCSNLTSISILDGVTSIEEYAFEGCVGLTNITIPNSVTSIGSGAFSDCSSLTNLIIPNGVTTIGDYTFNGCTSLKNISIPDSITSIGDDAFYGCDNLQYNTDDTAYYLGNSENPYLLLVGAISQSITSYTINSNTKFIGEYAFYGCRSLESLSIPSNVIGIGSGAFYDCNSLVSVTIPEGVADINDETFFCCTNLKNVIIPNTVKTIGKSAFEGCNNLENITLPNIVTSIGKNAFYECNSLKSISIPNGVTTISDKLFYNCSSLESVTLPNSITYISFKAFENCSSLQSISIPDNVIVIDQFAFKNCSKLKSIIIPNSVREIAFSAFSYCSSLESITLPNTIISIDSAFYGCTNLHYNTYDNAIYLGNDENPYLVLVEASSTEITSCKINSNTQIIMQHAFMNCKNLESVTFETVEGWVVANTPILNSPTPLSSSDLSNESTAATYLTSTHLYDYWKRV